MKASVIKLIIETRELRELQKSFLRTKSKYILSKCISKEKLVDRLLTEVIYENVELKNNPTATEIIQESFKFGES